MSYQGPLPIQGPYTGYSLVACGSVFIVVLTFLVSLRLYAKHYLSRARWGWDDYLLVPSLLFTLLLFATFMYMAVNLGGGYHLADIEMADPSLLVTYRKTIVLLTVASSLSLALPRCCVLASYLRFFASKKLRIMTWILLGMTIAHAVSSFIISFTVCVPLQGAWDPTVQAVCINQKEWWAAATIPVAIMDVFTMALPVSTILQLQRPLNERMALLATFLAYGFATIAEIVRIVIFESAVGQADQTWTFVPEGIASMCESGAYIIACCVPGLRSLWIHRKDRTQANRPPSELIHMSKHMTFHEGPRTELHLDALKIQIPDRSLAAIGRPAPVKAAAKDRPRSPNVIVVNQDFGDVQEVDRSNE